MNIHTTAWICSTCHVKGNAIHFLAKLREMSYEEARDHIYARYSIGPGAPIDDLASEVARNLARAGEQEPVRVAPSEAWVESLSIDWDDASHPAHAYMVVERGFSPDVLRRWQVGYDRISQRVSIPVRDVSGVLVGFKARAIDPDVQPRYLILGDPLGSPYPSRYHFHCYRKADHVFALDRCLRSPMWEQFCWVVEGELNAIAIWERFGQHAVAVAGSDFSDRQRELIARHVGVVHVYFDDDDAGRRGAANVASMLLPHVVTNVVLGAPADAAAISPHDFEDLRSTPALELAIVGDLVLDLST